MSDQLPEPAEPLHSAQRPRTRPQRRRRIPRPPRLERRRAALNRFTLIFGVLVGVSAIAVALLNEQSGDGGDGSGVGPPAPPEAVSVSVTRIVDGDTLHVETAAGEALTVRLYGVDTPEIGEACYAEATQRLRSLAGSSVLLLPDARLQDPGGRELRYVFTAAGASIDAALIDEGLAIAWRRDGAFRDDFIALEDAAVASDTGCLWAD